MQPADEPRRWRVHHQNGAAAQLLDDDVQLSDAGGRRITRGSEPSPEQSWSRAIDGGSDATIAGGLAATINGRKRPARPSLRSPAGRAR